MKFIDKEMGRLRLKAYWIKDSWDIRHIQISLLPQIRIWNMECTDGFGVKFNWLVYEAAFSFFKTRPWWTGK